MWLECKIVHGSLHHPQTQGSMECSNQGIENMAFGCVTIIHQTGLAGVSLCNIKKVSFHRIIGRSPYHALFGCDIKSALQSTNIFGSLLQCIHTEKDLGNVEVLTLNIIMWRFLTLHLTRNK